MRNRRDRNAFLLTTFSLVLTLTGVLAGAGPASADSSVQPIAVPGDSTPLSGVDQRLPGLNTGSYYSAGPAFAAQIEAYHDSGAYNDDQQAVATAAQDFLGGWLVSTCGDTSEAVCRPAVVFDVDDTLITAYKLYADNGFTLVGNQWRNSVFACEDAPIVPTRNLFNAVKRLGAAVFLITGRTESERAVTVKCLHKLGITGWQQLITKTPATASLSNEVYKSRARAALEAQGWRLGFSIGDQLSDLTGGHVAHGFLLPNPMYFVP